MWVGLGFFSGLRVSSSFWGWVSVCIVVAQGWLGVGSGFLFRWLV